METLEEINQEIKKMGYSTFIPRMERPNFYRIEEGIILRVYPIINSIEMEPDNPTGASINGQNVVALFVPKKFKGSPGDRPYSQADIQANIVNIDVPFDTLIENFNVYDVDDKWILSVKTTLSQVSKTSLRDSRGDPIYAISTALIPKLKPK